MDTRLILAAAILLWAATQRNRAESPEVAVGRSPDCQKVYMGCLSIVILPDGGCVASRSWFGPETENDSSVIFGPSNRGKTGTDPKDRRSGRLFKVPYRCAPVPLIVHGRVFSGLRDGVSKRSYTTGWCGGLTPPTSRNLLRCTRPADDAPDHVQGRASLREPKRLARRARAEVLDESGRAIAPFMAENCLPLCCDTTCVRAAWQSGEGLATVHGKKVRLRPPQGRGEAVRTSDGRGAGRFDPQVLSTFCAGQH